MDVVAFSTSAAGRKTLGIIAKSLSLRKICKLDTVQDEPNFVDQIAIKNPAGRASGVFALQPEFVFGPPVALRLAISFVDAA